MAKERVKFVLEGERRWNAGEGELNFAELCGEFGISRQQGYLWVRRYRDARHDLGAVTERSHRPHSSPTKVSLELDDGIVAAQGEAHLGAEEVCAHGSCRGAPTWSCRASPRGATS